VVFNYVLSKKPLTSSRFAFVHFDEHSDLGFPYLSSPVPRFGAAVGDNAKFAYDQLAIGNFVYPFLLQGRIDPFVWIRPDDMPLEASDRVQVV
jgi:hypothetical protein